MSEQLQVGDKVKFNGLEGKVVAVDYSSDRITVDVTERGGGKNLHYGHISQFRPVLVEPAVVEDSNGKHEAKVKDADA